MTSSRRDFLAASLTACAGASLTPRLAALPSSTGELYSISLAQWSLHRTIRGGELDNLDFARTAREVFGLDAVEYVNQFFADKVADFGYLDQMRRRADDAGVHSLLIMIDGEGALADADDARRRKAVENHFKWVVAARYLGCHSIRVNAAGSGEYDEQMKRAADSLNAIATLAEPYDINVIVENHGGLSSNGAWLAGVMKLADNQRVGTLPDFGNFHLGNGEWYDRYLGVEELMPYAKAVSAKSHEFDEAGNEVRTDYERMMKLVAAAGYRGYVGIEWEGGQVSEQDGILATKALLLRVRESLA
ncbi:MAG: sugar phosphate isomerase/epimerase family protein [Planctomycetota bacterium]